MRETLSPRAGLLAQFPTFTPALLLATEPPAPPGHKHALRGSASICLYSSPGNCSGPSQTGYLVRTVTLPCLQVQGLFMLPTASSYPRFLTVSQTWMFLNELQTFHVPLSTLLYFELPICLIFLCLFPSYLVFFHFPPYFFLED